VRNKLELRAVVARCWKGDNARLVTRTSLVGRGRPFRVGQSRTHKRRNGARTRRARRGSRGSLLGGRRGVGNRCSIHWATGAMWLGWAETGSSWSIHCRSYPALPWSPTCHRRSRVRVPSLPLSSPRRLARLCARLSAIWK